MSERQMGQQALDYRRKYRGVIGVESKIPVRDASVLSLVYTPGVAEPCLEIARDAERSFDLTMRGNTVAIITDGTGLTGGPEPQPEAALPLMEAKSVLFKTFAGIDAFPIALNTSDISRVVQTVNAMTPTFGAICLDTMAAPHSFSVADHLEKAATVPVFANGHHGTGVLVYAALVNALKVVGKSLERCRIVINGAGVAGIGVARLLRRMGAHDLVVCDRAGAIYSYREERMNWAKAYLAKETNPENRMGMLADVITGADVFIGLSAGNTLTGEMVATMAKDAIVFALAVPTPEIDPIVAREAGAKIVATGRSDYTNQLDVALVFPGFFRGLLDCRARNIRLRTLRYAAEALAGLVTPDELHADHIVPAIFDFRVAPAVAAAVARATNEAMESRLRADPDEVAERTLRYCYEGRLMENHRPHHREMTFREEAIDLRERYGGVLAVRSKIPIRDQHMLNMLYVPPAALAPAEEIRTNPMSVYDLTAKGNLVAIVTDGSAVLGLGDIGPRAALPVMEGKAVLFQTLAGVEAFPICLAARQVDEIVDIVKAIAPTFGGINLEDIAAPRCFEIERRLKEELDIPVFHDDQHGTAVVTLAALINALRVVDKKIEDVRIIMNGAGAAGIAVTDLLMLAGAKNVVLCDTRGALARGRAGMNAFKDEIAARTNPQRLDGSLADVLEGADVFIGVSAPGCVTVEMVQSMAPGAIVFAMANPVPEIAPDAARAGGAVVVATGRSDYPNQVNNSVAFPGIFRGALDVRARGINDAMKIAAAEAIAALVTESELRPDYILPKSLDLRVPSKVAAAVARVAMETGMARITVDAQRIEQNTRDLIYEGLIAAV